jgi:hypothetical protein
MVKTLASQARNGGSIPLARFAAQRQSDASGGRYQAWLLPQCGQLTEVETSALNA